MLEILLSFVKVKNYENRSKNGEVTTRNAIAYLFGPPCILETIIAFMLVLIRLHVFTAKIVLTALCESWL